MFGVRTSRYKPAAFIRRIPPRSCGRIARRRMPEPLSSARRVPQAFGVLKEAKFQGDSRHVKSSRHVFVGQKKSEPRVRKVSFRPYLKIYPRSGLFFCHHFVGKMKGSSPKGFLHFEGGPLFSQENVAKGTPPSQIPEPKAHDSWVPIPYS